MRSSTHWTQPYSAIYPGLFVKALPLRLQQLPKLYLDTGFDSESIRRPDATTNFQRFLALVSNAIDLSENPALALQAGAATTVASHGPVSVAMLTAPDVSTALAIMTRFIRIRGPFIETRVTDADDNCAIEIEVPQETSDRYPSILEFVALCIQSVIRVIVPEAAAGGRLELSYARPAHAALYGRYFNFPVSFGHERNRMILGPRSATTPIHTANPEILRIALQQCEALISVTRSSYAIDRQIRAVLERHQGQMLTVEQVAKQLCISSRTLQRRCAEQFTQFSEIQDQWHCELAGRYLTDPSVSIEAAASLVGFADLAGFRRAVRRWHGSTPAQLRT